MNYEKIANEIDNALWKGPNVHVSDTRKMVERACLEAQFEVLKECYERGKNRYHSTGDSFALLEVSNEIESKLKAMK